MNMKKHALNMKHLVVMAVAAAMVSVLALAGCSSSAASSSASASASASASSSAAASAVADADITVAVKVINSVDGDAVLYEGDIAAAEGVNALEALRDLGLEVVVSDGPYGPFVESIDGVANEGTKGWTYTVNAEQPPVAADQCMLVDGDMLEWSYIDMAS